MQKLIRKVPVHLCGTCTCTFLEAVAFDRPVGIKKCDHQLFFFAAVNQIHMSNPFHKMRVLIVPFDGNLVEYLFGNVCQYKIRKLSHLCDRTN